MVSCMFVTKSLLIIVDIDFPEIEGLLFVIKEMKFELPLKYRGHIKVSDE